MTNQTTWKVQKGNLISHMEKLSLFLEGYIESPKVKEAAHKRLYTRPRRDFYLSPRTDFIEKNKQFLVNGKNKQATIILNGEEINKQGSTVQTEMLIWTLLVPQSHVKGDKTDRLFHCFSMQRKIISSCTSVVMYDADGFLFQSMVSSKCNLY